MDFGWYPFAHPRIILFGKGCSTVIAVLRLFCHLRYRVQIQIDKVGSLLCESVILAIFILVRYLTCPILKFHLSFPGALQLLTVANQHFCSHFVSDVRRHLTLCRKHLQFSSVRSFEMARICPALRKIESPTDNKLRRAVLLQSQF